MKKDPLHPRFDKEINFPGELHFLIIAVTVYTGSEE